MTARIADSQSTWRGSYEKRRRTDKELGTLVQCDGLDHLAVPTLDRGAEGDNNVLSRFSNSVRSGRP